MFFIQMEITNSMINTQLSKVFHKITPNCFYIEEGEVGSNSIMILN